MAGKELVLSGITKSGRLVILLSSKGYSKKWSDPAEIGPQTKFGVNLIAYALASRKK